MALNDPVPSNAPDVLLRNMEDIDTFANGDELDVVNRVGNNIRTIAGAMHDFQNAIGASGYIPVTGSFESGGTITARNEVLLYEADGYYYRWAGDLSVPKVVVAASTPTTAGGVGAGAWTAVGGIDTGFFTTRTVTITGGLDELDLRYDNFDSATGNILDLDLQTSTRQYFFALVDGVSNAYSITGDNQITLNTTSSGGEVVTVWQNHPDKAFRYVFDTVEDLDSTDLIYTGQIVITAGYNSVGDSGGNLYQVVAAGTGTDDGGSFIDLTESGLQAKGLFPGGRFYAEQFGAKADGSDDAAAIQAIFTLGKPWELIDDKTYSIGSELTISNGDFNAKLFYCNGLATIKALPGFTGSSMVRVSNGSGELNMRKIEGVYFLGLNDNSINLLEFRGACGIRGYRCRFKDGLAGLKLSNDVGGGTFTEGIVFYDSRFQSCTYPLEYFRGAGNDSFHGSGLENCWINTTTGNPAVRIGDGCLPYNAPFSGTVFADDDNNSLVFSVEGVSEPRPPTFTGYIRTEGEIATLADGDRNIYLVGGVTGLGAQDFGRLYIAYSVRSTGPVAGNINAVVNLAPYRRGFGALNGESVLLAPSDSVAYVHMVAGGTEYYFKIFSYSGSTGTTTYATPEVYVGDLSGLTFTTSDAGVALTMPADGTLKIRVESASIRYTAVDTAALEYKE